MTLPSGGNLAAEARKSGNVIVLARGGTYTGVISPASGVTIAAEKGAGPAPVLIGQIQTSEVHDVTLDGFKVQPKGKASVKGVDLFHVQRVKVLNLDVSAFGWMGLAIQGLAGRRCSDVTVRGCNVSDNYPLDAKKHSAGAYLQFVDGLVLDANVFSHNGGAPGIATKFNHNVYIHGSCGPAVVTSNVFQGASSHGLQQRSGGVCTGNVFLDNPIHLSYGLVNGEMCFPGGVSGVIARNLFVGGGVLAGAYMGWGIQLGNLKLVSITDNIFANDPKAGGAALRFEKGDGIENPRDEMPASQSKVSVSGLYVYDRGNVAWTMENELKGILRPLMGANMGTAPPKQPDMRGPDVLGSGFMPWAQLNPSVAASKAIEKAWKAAGLN